MKGTLLFVVCFLGVAVMASPAKKGDPTDEEAIRKMVADYDEAWNKADLKGVTAFFAQDAVFTEAQGNVARGRAEIEKMYNEWLTSTYRGSRSHVETRAIRFLKPDAAVADGTWEDTGVRGPDGNELPPIRGVWTDVVAKQGGKWKIVALHASVPVTAPGQK